MKNFEGRVAVVTGAASGIGRATSLRLAARGCAIAAADIDPAGLETLEKELRERGHTVSAHQVDVSSSSAMEAFAGEVEDIHGAAHILVNNAGVVITGTFERQRLEDLRTAEKEAYDENEDDDEEEDEEGRLRQDEEGDR